jgi:hypothetical protein
VSVPFLLGLRIYGEIVMTRVDLGLRLPEKALGSTEARSPRSVHPRHQVIEFFFEILE